jgi:hypothetical protein
MVCIGSGLYHATAFLGAGILDGTTIIWFTGCLLFSISHVCIIHAAQWIKVIAMLLMVIICCFLIIRDETDVPIPITIPLSALFGIPLIIVTYLIATHRWYPRASLIPTAYISNEATTMSLRVYLLLVLTLGVAMITKYTLDGTGYKVCEPFAHTSINGHIWWHWWSGAACYYSLVLTATFRSSITHRVSYIQLNGDGIPMVSWSKPIRYKHDPHDDAHVGADGDGFYNNINDRIAAAAVAADVENGIHESNISPSNNSGSRPIWYPLIILFQASIFTEFIGTYPIVFSSFRRPCEGGNMSNLD